MNQKGLKRILKYNPVTGIFTWLTSPGVRVKVGSIAGSVSYGYIRIEIKKHSYAAHRLAWLYMTGKLPKKQIDHINHIRCDNRWVNFREVTQQENLKNKTMMKNNTSGITGVFWSKQNKKWVGQIRVKTKPIHLGYFKDKFEAICVRKSAENEYNFHVNHGLA